MKDPDLRSRWTAHPLYPVTIMRARYGGVYEGGAWVAFHCDPAEVPTEVWGDDIECSHWFSINADRIGTGSNPSAAVLELQAKCEAGTVLDPFRTRELFREVVPDE